MMLRGSWLVDADEEEEEEEGESDDVEGVDVGLDGGTAGLSS
jgi:hypothetical protein